MPWMKVSFTSQQILAHKGLDLSRELSFAAVGAPKDAGAFTGDTAALANEVYFTPSLVVLVRPLIDKYGGIECPAPKASDVPNKLFGDALGEFPFAPATPK